MLTDNQRDELVAMGPPNVRLHLAQWPGRGPGAAIGGFKCGDINRGDILDWLAIKDRADKRLQYWILFWAIVAALAGIAGVAVAVWHPW